MPPRVRALPALGRQNTPAPFERTLVLQAFLAAKFGGNPLDRADPTSAIRTIDPGTSAAGASPFLQAFLPFRAFVGPFALSPADLEAYDRELAVITDHLNAARPTTPIRWLYFQWVSLMFSAIYLDLYFHDPERLREELNTFLAAFNEKHQIRLTRYSLNDLRRFSFWLATGSGKTLLLHANIHQYRRYAGAHGAGTVAHTLVVVPNEALAKQHVAELGKSGLRARIYQKGDMELYAGTEVLVLVITNILDPDVRNRPAERRKEGDTMYDPARFGTKNLVLVDEGHRGKSDEGVWRNIRRYLGADGFTFEYSATLKEVAKGSDELRDEYARDIGADYAFRRFHHDGYGKHFRVLTFSTTTAERDLAMTAYLTGCLLAFYEQMLVFDTSPALAREYRIERPLAVFAGLKVAGPASEVLQSIEMLGRFLAERPRFEAIVQHLLAGTLVVRTTAGTNVFTGMFGEVRRVYDNDGSATYLDMVRRIFLAEAPAKLRAARRKEAAGEVQLRVGEGDPFAVVNVGDPGEVTKSLESTTASAWVIVEPEINGPSIFESLGGENARTTMLIGSKKFMEGWNSFRVSMLAIHNMGQGAGTQIVQLFGRGVRLRGKDGSLKRSSADHRRDAPGTPIERLRVLETLSLFTVNAAYLAAFEEQVKEALETDPEGTVTTVEIPIIGDKSIPRLRVPRFPRTEDFCKAAAVCVEPQGPTRDRPKEPRIDIQLDYYPRVGSRTSAGATGNAALAQEHIIDTLVPWIGLLNHDTLYEQCVRLRNEKGWHNLKLPRFVEAASGRLPLTRWLLEQKNWFRVAIAALYVTPEHQRDLGFLPVWERLAGELVRAYIERVYTYHRRVWQTAGATIVYLEELNEAERRDLFPEGYYTPEGARHRVSVTVKESDRGESDSVVQFVRDIASEVGRGHYNVSRKHGLRAVGGLRSLYRPLLCLDNSGGITIHCQPVALNAGEEAFVERMEAFVDGAPDALAGARVHLLRNESRRGMGFFVGAGFYPDFIVWIERDAKQWVIFVDPKGATHMSTRAAAEKLTLPSLLWDIERRNALPDVRLDAFLVISTREKDLDDAWVRAHAARIVFADQANYVEQIVTRAMAR